MSEEIVVVPEQVNDIGIINRLRFARLFDKFCAECQPKIFIYSRDNQFKPIPYNSLLCAKCLKMADKVLEKVSKSMKVKE
jgi:hypothetical protein